MILNNIEAGTEYGLVSRNFVHRLFHAKMINDPSTSYAFPPLIMTYAIYVITLFHSPSFLPFSSEVGLGLWSEGNPRASKQGWNPWCILIIQALIIMWTIAIDLVYDFVYFHGILCFSSTWTYVQKELLGITVQVCGLERNKNEGKYLNNYKVGKETFVKREW